MTYNGEKIDKRVGKMGKIRSLYKYYHIIKIIKCKNVRKNLQKEKIEKKPMEKP